MSSTRTHQNASQKMNKPRVSFGDVDLVHEVPCILRSGEALVLKNANSSTRNSTIYDSDKTKLWYSAQEFSKWRYEAARLVENVMMGRITTPPIVAPAAEIINDGSTKMQQQQQQHQTADDDHSVCLRGLERILRSKMDLSLSSTVDSVLRAQQIQRECGFRDEEELAEVGRRDSIISQQEALERALQDFQEAKRFYDASESLSLSSIRSTGSNSSKSKSYEDPFAFARSKRIGESSSRVKKLLRRTSRGIQWTLQWSGNNRLT
jgi:hypothetical protein